MQRRKKGCFRCTGSNDLYKSEANKWEFYRSFKLIRTIMCSKLFYVRPEKLLPDLITILFAQWVQDQQTTQESNKIIK